MRGKRPRRQDLTLQATGTVGAATATLDFGTGLVRPGDAGPAETFPG
jgi:hypothetical protein